MNRPIQFRNYLPAIFRADEINNVNFLSRFLHAFELLFEGIEAEIEGSRDPNTGDITGGGVPDLFDVDSTPPAQFTYRAQPNSDNPDPDFDFLSYLASWIALPLRNDPVQNATESDAAYFARRILLNRNFFRTSIAYYPERGTLTAMDAMLRVWLSGELLVTAPPIPILSDLKPPHTDVDAVFQLGTTPPEPGATLGFDTVLGEGAPYAFVADLVLNPLEPALRNPASLDIIHRAARFLLDAEKPAHTYYQLRLRSNTMQLPEPGKITIGEQPGAQIGVTTLLWDEPWVFNSNS